jgi:hypothetical protein
MPAVQRICIPHHKYVREVAGEARRKKRQQLHFLKSSIFWDIKQRSPSKTDVSEEYIASTFKDEEKEEQETSVEVYGKQSSV